MTSFNPLKNREGTYSLKWQKYANKDILPLWVADSEFECADAIKSALTNRVEHGVFGYHNPYQYEPGLAAIKRWLLKQYNWQVETDWIVWTPGVVPAFNMMCDAFGNGSEHDKTGVLVQVPNYPPLLNAPNMNGLLQETVGTTLVNGRWTLDFDELEKKAAKPSTRLFLMCNPMNPCGTVFSHEELLEVERICLEHDVLICSDEIHADLILNENKSHIPAGTLPKVGDKVVTLMAASKTFNVAGFGVSFAIIKDPDIRRRFKRAGQGIAPSANIFGVIATTAAFIDCDGWYSQQIEYLKQNQQMVKRCLDKIPNLSYHMSDATYLAWIDCTSLNLDDPHAFFESIGLGLSPGRDFGWPQFVRLNFACSSELLNVALERLMTGLKTLTP